MNLRAGLKGSSWYAFVLFVRAEWRARWPANLALAGVAAATVAVAVAMLTGAAQSETAFRRLRDATDASDAVVLYPDAQNAPASAVSAVDAIPGIEDATAAVELFVRPAGTELFPDFNFYSIAPQSAQTPSDLDAPVITSGRAVDPREPHEIVLSEDLAASLGVSVGESVRLESMTEQWIDVAFNGGDPGPADGPRVDARVVGLARTPADFGRLQGIMFMSPAFVDRYAGALNAYPGVYARLSEDALRGAQDGALPGLEGIDVGPSPFGDDAATDDGLGTIATALRLVAAAAALAGAVALALLLARLARVALADQATLVTLGWTRLQLAGGGILVCGPWLVLGVGIGVAAGVLASPVALVGLARSADPSPGSVVANAGILVGVAAVGVAGGLMIAAVAAWRATSRRDSGAPASRLRLSVGRPLPVVLGVRHALLGETRQGGRLSWGAIVVMAACIASVIAALMVSASIARLQSDPSLTGQGAGRVIDSGESVDVYDRALPLLEADDRVAMVTGVHVSFDISAVGHGDLTTLAYDVRRGELLPSVVRGRVAQRPDEVALGPATLDRLNQGVGDVVTLRGPRGEAEYQIVGSILLPEGDFEHDDGAALTTLGADRVLGDVHDAAQLHQVAFEWADGVDAKAADKDLSAAGLDVLTNETALQPATVTNLGEVEALPRFLAAFVAMLALVMLAHALAVSVRLRSREFGTLRALGITPRQNASIVATHALTIVVAAVAIGLPLGLAVGRQAWTAIANNAHVVVLTVAPWSWLALFLLLGIAATTALTAVPARRALRLRPAEALRAE